MRGSKTGLLGQPAGARPPRTARHSRQTDCQPAPRVVVPADKRKQLPNSSGFRRPATRCRWLYQSCLMLFGMPRGWGQSRQSPRRFWHCRIGAFTARFLGGQELWHLWGEHRPVVPMSGSEHGKCDIARPAILPRRPWAGTGRCRLPTCEYQVRAGAMSASGRKRTHCGQATSKADFQLLAWAWRARVLAALVTLIALQNAKKVFHAMEDNVRPCSEEAF